MRCGDILGARHHRLFVDDEHHRALRLAHIPVAVAGEQFGRHNYDGAAEAQARIKLDCVATDIMGKSGRDMLNALVAGERDPEVLANLARRQMRKKIPALREALQGRFEEHHALWIGAILAHIDFLDQQIERCDRPAAGTARVRR